MNKRLERFNPDDFTGNDLRRCVELIHEFIEGTARLVNAGKSYSLYDYAKAGSLAITEQESFPKPRLLVDAHCRGAMSLEAAADHLMVFADAITEPAKTIAPFTCVRGLMESCAIAIYFLDPDIDAQERVARVFAFRYEGFNEQRKMFGTAQSVSKKRQAADRQRVDDRITEVEQLALECGFAPIHEKKRIVGIAKRWPGPTQLIAQTLDKEWDYRMLSAAAHGHHWAISKLGFRVVQKNKQLDDIEDTDGFLHAAEKYVDPTTFLYLAYVAVSSLVQALWRQWQLFGQDQDELQEFLKQIYYQTPAVLPADDYCLERLRS